MRSLLNKMIGTWARGTSPLEELEVETIHASLPPLIIEAVW